MAPIVEMCAASIVYGAVALLLVWLNPREAALDPTDPARYTEMLPRIRLRPRPQAKAEVQAGRPRPGRRVVVLRVPRISFPMPGLRDRYIARSYLANFAMVLAAFWALFVLMSFMDFFDDIQ